MSKKLHEVASNCIGGVILTCKSTAFVTMLGLDHGDDFFHVTRDVRSPNAGMGLSNQERRTIRRLLLHGDVVDPFERRLPGVNFEDDLVAETNGFSNDTAGAGQGQATVFGYCRNFKDTDVVTAVFCVETVADILGKVTEVLVAHTDLASVDPFGNVLAGLVRPAAVDHVEGCPTVFSFSTDRGTDEEVELQLTLKVVGFNVVSQRDGHRFRVTGRSKAGPYQVLPIAEELDRIFRLHDFVEQGLATNATF